MFITEEREALHSKEGVGVGQESRYTNVRNTDTATMEISEVAPQEAVNRSTSRFSYITLGHRHKGLYILLQRHSLIYVHSCSIHNSQESKTA